MKRISTVLCMAVCFALLSIPHAVSAKPKIERSYSPAKDETAVAVQKVSLTKKLSYGAGYSHAGKQPSRPTEVLVAFTALRFVSFDNERPQWDKSTQMFLRYGDTPLTYEATYDCQYQNNKTWGTVAVETLSAWLPPSDFVALAKSGKVFALVGNNELVLENKTLEPLVTLADTIPD